METTEKIVEAYVRYIKGWATIPNLRCDGQHEIDLLAINPVTLERYHIEISVSGSQSYSKLTTKEFNEEFYKQRGKKAGQRRTLGFFIQKKFGMPQVKAKLAEYGFVESEYRNVVVTWDWTPEAKSAADEGGVILWSFQEIMIEIANNIRHQRSYFSDDTLRTINLFVRAMSAAEDKNLGAEVTKKSRKPNLQSENKAVSGAPFWVYRNWIHNRARLHKATCSYCNEGRGTQGAVGNATGEWLPFDTQDAAQMYLASLNYEDAGSCGVCI